MRTPDDLTSLYRRKGMKVTPQRRAVFGLLEGNTSHPTANDIFDSVRAQMPTVSRKTVYTILHELTEMGEIQSLDLGTGSLRFDPNVAAHHHMVCTACGIVDDVHGVEMGAVSVPDEAKRGFTIEEVELVFRGVCQQCGTGRSTIAND